MSGHVGLRALRGLVMSGALRPVGPRTAAGMARVMRTYGSSPATSTALNALKHPHEPAVIDDHGVVSNRELQDRAAAIGAALAAVHGVRTGSGVGILCRNGRGFVEAMAASGRLGADALLLNTDFPGPQLQQVLGRGGIDVLVCDAEFLTRVGDAGYDGPVIVAQHDGPVDRPTLDDLVAQQYPAPAAPTRSSRITILSSGTTGTPKGAGRAPSVAALLGPLVTMLEQVGLQARRPMLIGPPLFHGFGLSFMGTGQVLGCPLVLTRRFDPEAALDLIARHRVTTFVGVPVMLQRLLEAHDGQDCSSLRAVVSAGAPLPGHVSTRFMDRFGDIVFNAYGSTETGFGALATPADLRAAPGTIGRVPVGTTAAILDEARRPAAVGEVGHLFIGGKLVFEGYDGGGTKEVSGGLMNTGDLAHADAAGRLFIDGREDDMIVSGGENVFPQEVEETLATHPAVADVTVVGVEDAEFGQRLRAFVVPDGAEPDVDELLAHVRERLARYKLPREIVFVAEIPRTPTGKVLRRELA